MVSLALFTTYPPVYRGQTELRRQHSVLCAEASAVLQMPTRALHGHAACDMALQIPIDEALIALRVDALGKALPPPPPPLLVAFAAFLQRVAALQALDECQCSHCQRRTSARMPPLTLIVSSARSPRFWRAWRWCRGLAVGSCGRGLMTDSPRRPGLQAANVGYHVSVKSRAAAAAEGNGVSPQHDEMC